MQRLLGVATANLKSTCYYSSICAIRQPRRVGGHLIRVHARNLCPSRAHGGGARDTDSATVRDGRLAAPPVAVVPPCHGAVAGPGVPAAGCVLMVMVQRAALPI